MVLVEHASAVFLPDRRVSTPELPSGLPAADAGHVPPALDLTGRCATAGSSCAGRPRPSRRTRRCPCPPSARPHSAPARRSAAAPGACRAGLAGHRTRLHHPTRPPVEPRNFHREFKTRCRKAGVREISVHTTRRTCASLLVALDVHPRVTMQILRHSQIAVTMNIYSEATSTATQAALKRLGEQLR
ncbi:tyrosine-type recombinase/integrase [Micromonospora echinospora]|uniref:tyrosine-type recombinase/integrase n=1 Tax=Micromonospora echinospora TaxID=1877 RepID=UPI003F4CD0E9